MEELKTEIKFSYEDYRNLPESETNIYELIHGEFVMVPSPETYHQEISRNIEYFLWDFVRKNSLGFVYFAPFDVVFSKENVVQPDILYISKERSKIITENNIQGAPDLIIEILSKSTAERDKTLKKTLYAKYGVKEYWIVDPETKTVEVLILQKTGYAIDRIYKKNDTLTTSLLEELKIDLKEVF
ncbi:MAG: Uma2 family endonuclease [Spirochaetota bacterium]|nr:Uma2 family endonuclease [Spirochaetota bacterium]